MTLALARHAVFAVGAAAVVLAALWSMAATPAAGDADDLTELADRQHQPLAVDMFEMVNAERVERGHDRLAWDSDLAALAADWSARMHDEDSYGQHRDLGEARRQEPFASRYRGLGENINKHRFATADAATVTLLHVELMESDDHRANILRAAYDTVGVGVSCDEDDGATSVHVTQVFGVSDGSAVTTSGASSLTAGLQGSDAPPVEPIVGDDLLDAVSCDMVTDLGVPEDGITDDPTRYLGEEPDQPSDEPDEPDEPDAWTPLPPLPVGTVEVSALLDGAPATQVTVTAVPRDDDHGPVSATTGHDGTARLIDVPAGEATVHVDDDPSVRLDGSPPTVDVPLLDRTSVTLELTRADEDDEDDEGVEPGLDRVAGGDRVATSLSIAQQHTDPETTSEVVLARSDDYADALAAAPLAGAVGAPIVLTAGDALSEPDGSDSVADVLDDLDLDRIWLLGGERALSPALARAAAEHADEVTRVAGDDRDATAALVAEHVAREADDPASHAYVANGIDGWPDAVAVAALAAHERAPLLLASNDPSATAASEAIADADHLEDVRLVGGTSVLPDAVADAVTDAAGTPAHRIAGDDRWDTAAQLTSASVEAGLDGDEAWAATLADWPDSLAVAPAAAAAGEPVVFVDGSASAHEAVSDASASVLKRRSGVRVVGGESAVSGEVAGALRDALR